MGKLTMKNHFQIPLLLTCIGTLSTSIFIFAPAVHAGCEDGSSNNYASCIKREMDIHRSTVKSNQEWLNNLRNINSSTNNNNNNSSYRSTPSAPIEPTYTREQELNASKRLGEAFIDCLEKGGRIADCREVRVLR
jgi:hypothetical protein